MATPRTAVIAVHGVADQRAGTTSRALVDLLVAQAPQGHTYRAVDSRSLTLSVEPMAPSHQPRMRGVPTPAGEPRTFIKELLQSLRSDFRRSGWTAAETGARWRQQLGSRALDPNDDRGIAFSNYLLAKNQRNGAARESYETLQLSLEREAPGAPPSQVDVFEMYWADLSRLSGAMLRIVTELFTMIFRLSRLGRDTVDDAREALAAAGIGGRRGIGWSCAAWLQIGIDWLFANGLALLFLQLGLLGGLLLAVGLIRLADPLLVAHLDRLSAGAIAIAGWLVFAYRHREWQWRPLLPPLLLVAVGVLALFFVPALARWLVFALLIGLLTLIGETGLRIADERFPLVRRIGRAMWLVLVGVLAWSAWRQSSGGPDLDALARASILGVEVTLFAIKWAWIVLGALLLAWLVAGFVATAGKGAGYQAKASISSGRIGLGLSLSAFLAVTMMIWAMLSGVIGAAVAGVDYSPCIFRPVAQAPGTPVVPSVQAAALADAPAAAAAARACPLPPPAAAPAVLLPAPDFLQQRYRASTNAFGLVAMVLLLMMAFLLSMFVPSVLAEMQLLVKRMRRQRRHRPRETPAAAVNETRARRLGRWLTSGYRSLDGVAATVFAAGVGCGLAVAAIYVAQPWLDRLDALGRIEPQSGLAAWKARLDAAESFALGLSQGLLEPLVIGAAGVAAALVVFGGLLSRYLPGIRGPLDIALDVDNHFREFPRRAIPRARIFSRYQALLRHVAAADYQRIVVVAHSQGSVISAELLRLLSSDGRHAPASGARPRIDGTPLPPVALLTVGCPLRQLYAARFPTWYRWVLERRGGVSGPRAADIGVERWINAFCSGDYVGRWLWSDEPEADQDPLAHPMVESVATGFGRNDAYAGFVPMPPDDQAFAAATEAEMCLGLGAHTHYFDAGQSEVAWLVDRLIDPPAAAPSRAADASSRTN